MSDTVPYPSGEIIGSYVTLHTPKANYRIISGGVPRLKKNADRHHCPIGPTITASLERPATAAGDINATLELLNLFIRTSRRLMSFAQRSAVIACAFGILGVICILTGTGLGALLCWIVAAGIGVVGGVVSALTPPRNVDMEVFHLLYDMDATAKAHWQSLDDALSGLACAEKLWQITSHSSTDDWRRNSGSTEVDSRFSTSMFHETPRFIRTNAKPYCLQLQMGRLFFLPDRIYLLIGGDANDGGTDNYRTYAYTEVSLESGSLIFHESGTPPADSQVTGYIWQYVNKDGSPDLRFRNNRQLSACQYGSVTLRLGSDLDLLIHTSSATIAERFVLQFRQVIEQMKRDLVSAQPAAQHQDHSSKILGSPLHQNAPNTSVAQHNEEWMQAAAAGDINTLDALLRRGISIDTVSQNVGAMRGYTALHMAAMHGQVSVVEYLLTKGANCNISSVSGHTPLFLACASRQGKIIDDLLKAGANIDAQLVDGSTALGYALYGKYDALVRGLLKHGANPNVGGYNGFLALDIAISQSNRELVQLLLQMGADVNATGDNGYMALTSAIVTNKQDIIQTLLEAGANRDYINPHGNTPLMDAAIEGVPAVVKLLLQYGANMSVINSKGQTALDCATLSGHGELVNLLQNAATTKDQIVSKKQKKPLTSLALTASNPQAGVQSYDDLLRELKELVGLENVKNDVEQLVTFLEVQRQRRERGLRVPDESLHMVFTGNPGTGKTTVARLVAQIYKSLGVLSQGQFIETDRSGIVGGYLGQTALKTKEVVESAIGGVLFIDEAYSLTQHGSADGDAFGEEAISTLLKLMEDHRNDLIVIAAGYTEPMQSFIRSNPGLQSRFNNFLCFEDYDPEQLVAIFQQLARKNDYVLEPQAVAKCTALFQKLYASRDRAFGNARLARNLFEKTINRQAVRIVRIKDPSKEALCSLEADDIPSAQA